MRPGPSTSPCVRIDASAENRGTSLVWHTDGCSTEAGIALWFVDPLGRRVWDRDPAADPECPDQFVWLEPGATFRASVRFVGRVYTDDGTAHTAVPGRYRIVARFM